MREQDLFIDCWWCDDYYGWQAVVVDLASDNPDEVINHSGDINWPIELNIWSKDQIDQVVDAIAEAFPDCAFTVSPHAYDSNSPDR